MQMIGDIDTAPEMLEANLALRLLPGSFTVPWSQCGATADFLAAFVAGAAADRPTAGADEISCAVNELLENAIKFCHGGPIEVEVGLRRSDVVCRVTNPALADASDLRERLTKLVACDPVEGLVARVEENATRGDSDAGIGLLTLRADYGVALGFRLEVDASRAGVVLVETSARIPGSRP